ncbi:uncharacterized protein LOC105431748 isoform X1 [Pogonomyrmex barbatus]|uniref:Uncharacterized protein LOC105431748 isoform X1 n=1 Tax=Pogonomyrmex barbatus TaxID=144034 RepID=A0A6I9WWY5_9HYME|nr:uncharacterized protein LOC105431748 isoform X1 [Pogonomyrmex barbatus]
MRFVIFILIAMIIAACQAGSQAGQGCGSVSQSCMYSPCCDGLECVPHAHVCVEPKGPYGTVFHPGSADEFQPGNAEQKCVSLRQRCRRDSDCCRYMECVRHANVCTYLPPPYGEDNRPLDPHSEPPKTPY